MSWIFGKESTSSAGGVEAAQVVRARGDVHVPLARTPAKESLSAANAPFPQAKGAVKSLRHAGEISSLDVIKELLPRWQGGWVTGIVAPTEDRGFVLLWLGIGDVVLAGTRATLTSAPAAAIRERVMGQHSLTIVDEVMLTPTVLNSMRQVPQVQGKRGSGPINIDEVPLQVYDDIFEVARVGNASDIHIDIPLGDKRDAKVKMRLNGRLRHWRKGIPSQLLRSSLEASFGRRLLPKTNTRSHLSWENAIAYMTTQTSPDGATWRGRCNGRPTVRGYKMVIRLLESNPDVSTIPTLDGLGMAASHVRTLRTTIACNWGVNIIFGSTGSGKSTSLRTQMVRENDPEELVVYAVESPVEYDLPGVHQIPVPIDVNMSSDEVSAKFLAVLRDVVRMDPEVLMVGELRDRETTSLMSEFAVSGHRCYTTAHGDGVVDGLMRLCGETLGMPAEKFLGQRFLACSTYQRMLPRLCPHCKISATDPQRGLTRSKQDLLVKKFKLDPSRMFVANEQGCEHCRPNVPEMPANGTKGVAIAAEVLVPTQPIREALGSRDWAKVTRLWRSTRRSGFDHEDMQGKTAYECALFFASQGIVSILDVEKEIEPLEQYEIYPIVESEVNP
jgi:type II secretory ATPase GspE/PulE/Tfp pilus assembly ATPase PilB-like protein